ncbi:usg protein [Novosphingobium sp. 2580]|uniref:Usg protein n=2 Tax=Novosphingobium album (ex Hu et al. 2023) TaxID=2930093 RepID=A0ABT0B1J7_9SPHN|nr:usg protein [Novosphingobium album (ex Hu et al. 2023)]
MAGRLEGVHPGFRASPDFIRQMEGYGLTTVEIHYFFPDHPKLLQLFAFQQYDEAPTFPVLRKFLDYWAREIEGPLHSVRVAHKKLIGPQEWRAVNGVISIH